MSRRSTFLNLHIACRRPEKDRRGGWSCETMQWTTDQKDARSQSLWSGRWDLNPRQLAWEAHSVFTLHDTRRYTKQQEAQTTIRLQHQQAAACNIETHRQP